MELILQSNIATTMESQLSNEPNGMPTFQLKAGKDYRSVFVTEAANVEGLLSELCRYWNIAKTVLEAAKMIKPANANKAIDNLCRIIDRLCRTKDVQARNELLDQFNEVWETVKPKLLAAKVITGPKVEAIVDEVIRICDSLANR